MTPRRLRWLVLAALVVVGAGLFPSLVAAGCPYRVPSAWCPPDGTARTPWADLARAWQEAVGARSAAPLWAARLWYPYVLAGLWIVAGLAAWGAPADHRNGRRRLAGALLWGASLAVVVLEGAYLAADYEPLAAGAWADVETPAVYVAVVAVLFLRRSEDRHLGAIEGTIGAQALLSTLHLATLPSTYARRWYEAGDQVGAIGARLAEAFPPAFAVAWLACVAAAGVALLGAPRRRPEAQVALCTPSAGP